LMEAGDYAAAMRELRLAARAGGVRFPRF